MQSSEFTPGKLPSNDYAFKNMLFVHPQDFKEFLAQNGNREPVYVEVKNHVLRLAPLDSIGIGEFGASALQKEAMRISKIDTIKIAVKRVREENPLGGITCDLSLIFCAPDAPMEQGLVSL
jgi:vesicle-fusing ATPase